MRMRSKFSKVGYNHIFMDTLIVRQLDEQTTLVFLRTAKVAKKIKNKYNVR